MKTLRKLPFVLTAMVIVSIVSCASSRTFMPLAPHETVIGTIQAIFVARTTLNGRDALNTQAYLKLLETAKRLYPRNGEDGVPVDIRDIVFVSSRGVDNMHQEYTVAGKVIKAE